MIVTSFLALIVIIVIFCLLVIGIKYINKKYLTRILGSSNLKILEISYLDPHTKLLSIKYDNVKYLILMSKNGSLVIDKKDVNINYENKNERLA